MNSQYRTIIAIGVSVLMVVTAYFGSYLPIKKSQRFIQTYSQNEARSLQEFNRIFDEVMGLYSPVGQEEIVSNYLSIANNVIQNQKEEVIVRSLVGKAEEYALPIIETGRGLNFSQILLSMGLVYKSAAMKLNDTEYYNKAVTTLRMGMEYSPNRPAFLYHLFELYYAKGDKEHTKEIGEIILRYWPNEIKVKEIIEKL